MQLHRDGRLTPQHRNTRNLRRSKDEASVRVPRGGVNLLVLQPSLPQTSTKVLGKLLTLGAGKNRTVSRDLSR